MASNNRIIWVYWLLVTGVIGGILGYKLFVDEEKSVFLPGETSHGHYQIEMACSTCHTDSFTSKESMQDACMSCHATELKEADDSHPKSKFTNPRNADRVAKLDARYCVTCHTEHNPDVTGPMGVTVQEDICIVCHQDIAEDRPSHKGMSFTSCATAGCHNFHDNRALYEDFLVKHANEPAVHEKPLVHERDFLARIELVQNYPVDKYPVKKLESSEKDVPLSLQPDQKIIEEWSTTAHAKSGVNCTACHNVKDELGKLTWVDKPGEKVCQTCHDVETESFLAGKHGMRLAQDLSAMTPAMARISMRPSAHDKELSCVSCHSSHNFNVQFAATEACLKCHDDKHSLAYKDSPHFKLWHMELSTGSGTNEGVSCATCHMPRVEKAFPGGNKKIIVQHNQNDNLRPNEKMIRSVCMNCHGLEFSIDALADKDLVEKNFTGLPGIHIESIDLATQRVKDKGKGKK